MRVMLQEKRKKKTVPSALLYMSVCFAISFRWNLKIQRIKQESLRFPFIQRSPVWLLGAFERSGLTAYSTIRGTICTCAGKSLRMSSIWFSTEPKERNMEASCVFKAT
ncbi:hypothetical protein BRADI_4g07563v3 [Brachypodium distachyon]|uniref:Uncharacterized protein n=1 Tax=Brachypodium distachyon TaxID=15368 RepID=A0A0Q3PC85_BRADI|nr:hypothetical protein BRADI_4g07563v3 [Brachypodium distachyon]